MKDIEWEDDIFDDLNLGCQNIFEEISLDFLNVAESTEEKDFYEPKSKNVVVIKSTIPT